MSSNSCIGEAHLEFKKRSLRDAVLCIGWFKMMSATFYISLYFITKFYSHGAMMVTLLLLVLIGIIPSVFLGMMLFLGSLQECLDAVITGQITCYILATYDLTVGLIGAMYHVIIAVDIQDYILTLAFILLALTCLPAYLHDGFVINSYKQILCDEKNGTVSDVCCECD